MSCRCLPSPALAPKTRLALSVDHTRHERSGYQSRNSGLKVPMKSGPKSLSAQFSAVSAQFCASPMSFLFVPGGLAVGKRAVNVR